MFPIISASKEIIPESKPVYVMGIGSPIELLEAVSLGVDIFDSAYPTRMARHGKIFTHKGDIQISRSVHKKDFSPLDASCSCFVCKNHSRAYLHHLFKTYEQNGLMLLSYHNTFFIADLMRNIRLAIKENRFELFKKEFVRNYSSK